MIKSIVSQSPWLNVNTYNNTPYMPGGLQSSGMVRYNTSMQRLEVYDGNAWLELGGGSSVDLSLSAQSVLEWASKKMEEERNWQEMAERNPSIKDAYNKFKQAEEQLKIVQALVQCNN
jgi:hypothetical protein